MQNKQQHQQQIPVRRINKIITIAIKQAKISKVVKVVRNYSKNLKEHMEEQILSRLLILIQLSTLKWSRTTLTRIRIITNILEVRVFVFLTIMLIQPNQ